VHQIFLGGDLKAGEIFTVNMGVGFDVGHNGPGVVVKSRLEWDWRKSP
jgi:hypothetical protein